MISFAEIRPTAAHGRLPLVGRGGAGRAWSFRACGAAGTAVVPPFCFPLCSSSGCSGSAEMAGFQS